VHEYLLVCGNLVWVKKHVRLRPHRMPEMRDNEERGIF